MNQAPRSELGQTKAPNIETTEEEIEAFRITRAILAGIVPMNRVHIRDQASYCSVILYDNNRKPIARYHFGGRVKRMTIFDEEKQPTRVDIENLEDIYAQADMLRRVVAHYVAASTK